MIKLMLPATLMAAGLALSPAPGLTAATDRTAPLDTAANAALEAAMTAAAALDAAMTTADHPRLHQLLAPDFHQEGATFGMFGAPIDRDTFGKTVDELHAGLTGLERKSKVLAATADGMTLLVETAGTQTGPLLGQAPSGHRLTLTALEVWTRDATGRLNSLRRQSDDLETLRQITAPLPRPTPYEPLPARTVATFPAGTFLESILPGDDGALLVTVLGSGRIVKVSPDGETATFATLPLGGTPEQPGSIMCLARSRSGALYATAHSPDPARHGVWVIGRDGRSRPLAALPPDSIPNGIAIGDNGQIYVADSRLGTLWRIDPASGDAERWFSDPLVAARPYIGQYPGANGLQHAAGTLFAANSDRGLVVAIPITDAGAPGPARVVADALAADDFAIDRDGTLYLTTHPFNTVVRLRPDGSRTIVAAPSEGAVGPTAAAILTGPDGRRQLYVVTDGGLYSPLANGPQSGPQPAKLIRLDLTP